MSKHTTTIEIRLDAHLLRGLRKVSDFNTRIGERVTDELIKHRAGLLAHRELFTYADLEELGLGEQTTIWRKVNDGRFPEPDLRVEDRPRWRRTTIINYLESLPRTRHACLSLPSTAKDAPGQERPSY